MLVIRFTTSFLWLLLACLCIGGYSYANDIELPTSTKPDIKTVNKPDIQLATAFDKSVADITQYLVSEKLDGVRGYWDGKEMYSRSGRKILLPDWFIEDFPDYPLDGELWIKRGAFEQVSSIVRKSKVSDKEWARVKFMVFDLPTESSGFELRYQKAVKELANISPYLKVIEQNYLASFQALETELQEVIAKNGEGLMLHKKNAFYKSGRSKDIVKLKPFYDAEAKVIGYSPGKGRFSGMMGALVVKNQQGITFNLGTGFTKEQRQSPPQIGSLVTYKYYGLTQKGTPRFASFLRVRHAK
ncbi:MULTISPECIES: DNA ligase [unclassified Shewanella]|uniref:DNA ligase n=1 Tax=unclassified Shewanella TaxID=196818 RepID=UPI001BC3E1D8|nr:MULTISPECIES: DNA ligase [unclassified Shewanella]GIU12718.1 ATP-dependent DNA ligase [Shewanella sp. MBTL60-112-B1]GIU38104.1 ATP-dependent DNA ligase [Shewanella sp. MBTL60-112-B2]